jgi:hypothetical protein
MPRKKYLREKVASASILGLGIGWLLTYLYVYLVYLAGYDINIVSPSFIGTGLISMFVTGLLYYTTLLVI